MTPSHREMRARLDGLGPDERQLLMKRRATYRAEVGRAGRPWLQIGLALGALALAVSAWAFWFELRSPAKDSGPWFVLLLIAAFVFILVGDRRGRRFEREHPFGSDNPRPSTAGIADERNVERTA